MSPTSAKPKAIVAHPQWGRGGAEAAAMWIIAALVQDFDVTVYTRHGFDLPALNRLAGTSVTESALTLRPAKVEPRLPVGAFAAGAFLRSLKTVGAAYDLRVTASGVAPWGLPALHFVSSIEWSSSLVRELSEATRPALRTRMSQRLISLSSGWRRNLSRDVFVTNSHWLRRQCAPLCPGPIRVIHPAVPVLSQGADWDARENTVLVFGRISPEKRIESCIQIVERARAAGFTGRLLIAGPDGEAEYAAYIRKLAKTRDWIELLPSRGGADKARLLGSVRYGLNACQIEAFGISTAEMMACGVVTLVPANTGQSEIVSDSAQSYTTETQAAERLIEISRNPALQRRLHSQAQVLRGRFAPDRFIAAVRETTCAALKNVTSSAKQTR